MSSGIPNLAVKVEQRDSIYVCDYGGAMAPEVIGAVMLLVVHELETSARLRLIE